MFARLCQGNPVFRRAVAPAIFGRPASGDETVTESQRTVREGITVGLIGYAAVALFYTGFDLLASRGTLYTVDLLGRTMFQGLRDPAVLQFPLERDVTAILLYNAFHFAVALAVGLFVTFLARSAERSPARRSMVQLVIVAGFFVTVAVVGMLSAPIRPVLPWWSIVVANALAALLAGMFLLRRNPEMRSLLPGGAGRLPAIEQLQ
jgi:hypothetical protein